MNKELLTVEQLANYLSLAKITIYRMLKKGQVPAIRVANQWRFRRSDIDVWLESSSSSPPERIIVSPGAIAGRRVSAGLYEEYSWSFKRFITEAFQRFDPDYVVVLDRKGAKVCEFFDAIPSEWSDRVFFPAAFKEGSKMQLNGKTVVLIDEISQHGHQFAKERSQFERVGAHVETLALARRRFCFDRGEFADPRARVCLDLHDREFRRFTARISGALLRLGKPLDVDHTVACFDIKPKTSVLDFVDTLSLFGRVHFLPTPAEEHGIVAFTIDEPNFFCLSSFKLPKGVVQEGVCKIRVYYDPEGEKVYLVPIVFPMARIVPRSFKAEVFRRNDDLAELVEKFESGFVDASAEREAEMCYESLILWLSAALISRFVAVLNSSELGFQLREASRLVPLDDFVRNFGSELGGVLCEMVTDRIRVSPSNPWKYAAQIPTPRPKAREMSDQQFLAECPSKEDACEAVAELLSGRTEQADAEPALTVTELLEAIPGLKRRTLSTVLDVLLDRGIVKPLNRIREGDGEGAFICCRAYRIGEYGSWRGDSAAMNDEIWQRERVARLIPYVLDYMMTHGQKQKEGVGGVLTYKLLVNLQHDWNEKLFDDLYLTWRPYLFGPIPYVPMTYQPQGGLHSLVAFAQKVRTYVFDRENKLFKPNSNRLWEEDFEEYFGAEEQNALDGLLELYNAIYRDLDDEKTDILTTLSACRDLQKTYIHGHAAVRYWLERAAIIMSLMKLELAQLEPGNRVLEPELRRFALGHASLEDKIRRYSGIGETKKRLEETLRNHPQRGLARRVIESIDDAPTIGDGYPYPIARADEIGPLMKAFTSFVRQGLSSLNVAGDTRRAGARVDVETGNPKNLKWYADRLKETVERLNIGGAQIMNAYDAFLEDDRDALCVLLPLILERIESFIERNLPDPEAVNPQAARESLDERQKLAIEMFSRLQDTGERGVGFISIGSCAPSSETGDAGAGKDIGEVLKGSGASVTEVLQRARKQCLEVEVVAEKGADCWVLTCDCSDGLVRFAAEVQQTLVKDGVSSLPRFGLHWVKVEAEPGMAARGGIIAFYIADRSGAARGGDIVISAQLYNHLSEQLRARCTHLQGYRVKCLEFEDELYRFNWESLGGTS